MLTRMALPMLATLALCSGATAQSPTKIFQALAICGNNGVVPKFWRGERLGRQDLGGVASQSSVRARRFFPADSHFVSRRPIWLGDAVQP
jgi:hypothetical protein